MKHVHGTSQSHTVRHRVRSSPMAASGVSSGDKLRERLSWRTGLALMAFGKNKQDILHLIL